MNKPDIIIRDEQPADVSAISTVTIAAFEKMEISSHTEHLIVDSLRANDALTLSLVAEINKCLVGHIAFSPLTISDGSENWYGLGPVSVQPDTQGTGIGKALVQEGITRLKTLGAKGCCLVGHPEYYRKFGFRNSSDLHCQGIPEEVFFVLPFDGDIPKGTVRFHAAFNVSN